MARIFPAGEDATITPFGLDFRNRSIYQSRAIMTTRTTICLLASLLLGILPSAARTWTEAGSGRTLEGKFLRTEGDKVVITRPNGVTVKVPLDKLSDEDRKFVGEAAAEAARPVANNVFKWETDFEVAKQRALDEDKPMLLDFTGSDWCTWCIRLHKEVFSTPAFREYAKENLVLVEVDFPSGKRQSRKLKAQNAELQKTYKVQGYPTVILLDSSGKKVGQTGYQEGGPENYIQHLKGLLK